MHVGWWGGWVSCTSNFTLSSLPPNHLPPPFFASDHTKMQEIVRQLQEMKMLSPEWSYYSSYTNVVLLSHTHTQRGRQLVCNFSRLWHVQYNDNIYVLYNPILTYLHTLNTHAYYTLLLPLHGLACHSTWGTFIWLLTVCVCVHVLADVLLVLFHTHF